MCGLFSLTVNNTTVLKCLNWANRDCANCREMSLLVAVALNDRHSYIVVAKYYQNFTF